MGKYTRNRKKQMKKKRTQWIKNFKICKKKRLFLIKCCQGEKVFVCAQQAYSMNNLFENSIYITWCGLTETQSIIFFWVHLWIKISNESWMGETTFIHIFRYVSIVYLPNRLANESYSVVIKILFFS